MSRVSGTFAQYLWPCGTRWLAGQLLRAAVELAKQWRQDKAMRFLQAELLVADPSTTLTVSGASHA